MLKIHSFDFMDILENMLHCSKYNHTNSPFYES